MTLIMWVCPANYYYHSMTSTTSPTFDPSYHNRQWKVQRYGFAGIGLLCLLGISGLFGSGPLSSGNRASQFFTIDYNRFGRVHAESSRLLIHDIQDPSDGEPLRISISQSFMKSVHFTNVTPSPDRSSFSQDGVTLSFNSEQNVSNHDVLIEFEPQKIGSIDGEVAVNDHDPLKFAQFIFP